MTASSRPPFLYPPGSPLMHPPLALQKARLYGFWVPGDLNALQKSIDRTLNDCSRGDMHFAVLTHYVLLSFAEIRHAHSAYPVDVVKGWGKEVDIVTWVMVGATKPGEVLPTFYAYPLHIWVDDAMALINGRELYGYPKYDCLYAMPNPDELPTTFRLAAKGFQPFSPESELAMHPLLDLDALPGLLDEPTKDVLAWREGLVAAMHETPGFWDTHPAWRKTFDKWFEFFPGVDQIFLKQFPDGTGHRAVYQAIVAAPAKVKEIRALALLSGRYDMRLHPFDSFPLDRTLGWKVGLQQAHCGFRIDFDFEVGEGVELVDNSIRKEHD
ncbi:acetoacetate decarboxylase family protein [Dyella sp. 2HG41-7]|uniref:acetoacetate decarboxylase family protein n=1 Tax=Dyella sp. 2HG41-7 TaxID=2883239 RepID=UPI001F264F94|nr:acetoacetate decarboxylase family protein [Dyella sp. 2HG41-7]